MAENTFVKPGLAVNQLPPVTVADEGKVLMVVDGKWAVANLPEPEPEPESEPEENEPE